MITIWHNATIAPMDSAPGLLADAALAVQDGTIAWIGALDQLPAPLARGASAQVDAGQRLITPALVDCHTHLVYGGSRAREFELRLEGASYEDIARNGGGIASTVQATRAAGEAALFAQARERLQAMLREGVGAVEIKSGYGLSLEHEAAMLRVARRLGAELELTVHCTFLGAHALAPEFAGRPDDYIDAVCSWLAPLQAQALVDSVDAFCDRIGFTAAQVERVFRCARALGLPVRLHAEQLSNQHGAALAARYGALSCDHLEHLDPAGVEAMAAAGTVAVLLPGAYYFLRDTVLPPVAALRAAGVPLAVASDHNPGTAPVLSPQLMLNMACVLFRLTPWEALAGMTRHAARALGLQDTHGTLRAGRRADFVLWDAAEPRDLAYRIGGSACRQRVCGGRPQMPRADLPAEDSSAGAAMAGTLP